LGFTPLIASSSLQAKLVFCHGLQKLHHRRRRPWSRRLLPSTKLTSNSISEASIAPGGGPFSRATSAVSSSPPCSTGLGITARWPVRYDLRTKMPHRHSGVPSWDTPLERRQGQCLPDVPLRVLRPPGRSPAVMRHGGRPSPLTSYRDLFYVHVQGRRSQGSRFGVITELGQGFRCKIVHLLGWHL
jgi:hypothetical protein